MNSPDDLSKSIKTHANKMKNFKTVTFFFLCLFTAVPHVQAQSDSTNTAKDSTKISDYKKLFKDKRVETAKGLITLHKIDEQVYFEFPKKLFGEKMLLGSVVVATSNRQDAAAGEQANQPVTIYFTRYDSVVYIRKANFGIITDENSKNIRDALSLNSLGPVVASFNIKAVTPDSNSVVFNVTDFFVSGDKDIDPFGPYSSGGSIFGSSSYSYDSRNSMLAGIMAFENNVTVSSILSFNVTSRFFGFVSEKDRPATFLVKRSLVLLPEETMQPRVHDPRIGVESSRYTMIAGSGMEPIYYAHRWALIPSDKDAFKDGELVRPEKPVIIYVDNEFPDKWMPNIFKGINDWNKAFKKIGFKNAIVIRMFDENSPNFDVNNIKYNTVNYIMSPAASAQATAWVDPRSGEIISASAYIHQGMVERLRNTIFLTMSPSLKSARTLNMPENLMGKAIRDIVAHQVGHMLGLSDNPGASASYPVDSLRSPSFTQKYGITSSIMDKTFFNLVAQPGDIERGVNWTRPNLGIYDYYSINWLYQPLYYVDSQKEKSEILRKWVSQKIKNPKYRLHRLYLENIFYASAARIKRYDLGEDQMKATAYTMKNLKRLLQNIDEWLKDEDENYTFRTKMGYRIINIRFTWYIRQVIINIGGIHQYENYASDSFPAYHVVSEEVQRESVLFLLKLLENINWLNTPIKINGVYENPSVHIRNFYIEFILDRGMENLVYSQKKSFENTYTQSEFLKTVFEYVWSPVIRNESSTEIEVDMQKSVLMWLLSSRPAKADVGSSSGTSMAFTLRQLKIITLGMSRNKVDKLSNFYTGQASLPNNLNQLLFDNKEIVTGQNTTTSSRYTIFKLLRESKDLLKKAIELNDGKAERRYKYLLMKTNRALSDE